MWPLRPFDTTALEHSERLHNAEMTSDLLSTQINELRSTQRPSSSLLTSPLCYLYTLINSPPYSLEMVWTVCKGKVVPVLN
jgi:hypothetical protein